MSLKKMKGACVTAAFLCTAICGPTQGMSVLAVTVGPMIAELAAGLTVELVPKIKAAIKTLTTKEGQCKICAKTGGVSCRGEKTESFCKSRCQERVELGSGYVLKIRFTDKDKWNIRTCVETARNLRPDRSDKNPKEIAVYNRTDADLALDLITKIVAADRIIAEKGNVKNKETDKKDSLTPETKKKVEQAKQGREKALQNLVVGYDPNDLEPVKKLIAGIVENQKIISLYGEETDVKKSPEEILKEAKQDREDTLASLVNLLSNESFGPQ